MFQVGEAVSYGTNGVCTIEEKKRIKLAGQPCDCYILKPVYDSSLKICVPCNSKVLLARMRALPSKEELLELLQEPAPCHEENPEVRKEQYRQTLQSGDRHALLQMIRDIYTERQHRGENSFPVMRTALCEKRKTSCTVNLPIPWELIYKRYRPLLRITWKVQPTGKGKPIPHNVIG